ncbi:MAG: restriction endonuclease [Candidatus Thorarchaeota archaeon]
MKKVIGLAEFKRLRELLPEVVELLGERQHSKASERYIDVVFTYPDIKETWEGSIPIEYRRTGIHARTPEEITAIILRAYGAMKPANRVKWLSEQEKYWAESNKPVTRPFFEALTSFEWTCQRCGLPNNPNWARRMQDIKELGYTIATDTNRYCSKCGQNTTHLILTALPRGQETGYETWEPQLRKRILKILGNYDVYENRISSAYALLPDHKFPEIRWDERTRQENPRDMTAEEIKAKYQLMSNQRNQQKREVCRTCFQTGQRGTPFGILYFYEGDATWSLDIPVRGIEAEHGCVGCGWYDMQKWRRSLNQLLLDR